MIRVEAKDISDQVSYEDRGIIENGLVSFEMADDSEKEGWENLSLERISILIVILDKV